MTARYLMPGAFIEEIDYRREYLCQWVEYQSLGPVRHIDTEAVVDKKLFSNLGSFPDKITTKEGLMWWVEVENIGGGNCFACDEKLTSMHSVASGYTYFVCENCDKIKEL